MALIAAGIALLALLALVAIQSGMVPGGATSARGLITRVDARDIGHAALVELRVEDGRVLRFQVEDSVDMTPGHLREHMTFGEPVTIYYRRQGDTLIATTVTD